MDTAASFDSILDNLSITLNVSSNNNTRNNSRYNIPINGSSATTEENRKARSKSLNKMYVPVTSSNSNTTTTTDSNTTSPTFGSVNRGNEVEENVEGDSGSNPPTSQQDQDSANPPPSSVATLKTSMHTRSNKTHTRKRSVSFDSNTRIDDSLFDPVRNTSTSEAATNITPKEEKTDSPRSLSTSDLAAEANRSRSRSVGNSPNNSKDQSPNATETQATTLDTETGGGEETEEKIGEEKESGSRATSPTGSVSTGLSSFGNNNNTINNKTEYFTLRVENLSNDMTSTYPLSEFIIISLVDEHEVYCTTCSLVS